MLYQYPWFFQVAAISVPDHRLGENICACIVPKSEVNLTEEMILEHFDRIHKTDEGLGMTPRYFMFLDSFPVVEAKIDRKILQKMAIEKFDLI